jgi:uncharacterized membrane protein YhfC
MIIVLGTSMAVAGLGCLAYEKGWLPAMLAVETVVALVVMLAMRHVIARSPWKEE